MRSEGVYGLQGKGFVYKLTATNIRTREVGVFTSEKTYATEDDAKEAVQQEYLVLRGQAYDIWHSIGAERIANDVTRLAELSQKDITADMTNAEKFEILNAQVIMRQYDWYRGVSKRLCNDTALLVLQWLTSLVGLAHRHR
jgi:histone acetyltransferase (RNA polymerase elongator complex component)